MEEDKLIRKLQKTGKNQYANILIEKYYNEIYVYIYKKLFNKDEAMDITQDIFISMLKSINRFDSKKSAFRTWLYRIAYNKTVDYFRRIKSFDLDIEKIELISEDIFTKLIEDSDQIERIRIYVESLSTNSQMIFKFKFYDELTFKEIAGELGCSESTIKTKYYRLISKIRKEFNNE